MDSVETLFGKITKLKNDQKQLEEQLSNLKLEINKKKIEELNNYWSKEEKKDENISEKLKELKIKINNQLVLKTVEHTFQYIPLDNSYTRVFISGDFNNWDMTEMLRDYSKKEIIFIYKVNLDKGFEYAYCFYSNGERLIDFNQPEKKIAYKDNQEYNYINIPNDEGNFIQFNQIKISQGNDAKKSSESLINIKGDENEFINNVFQLNELIYQKK